MSAPRPAPHDFAVFRAADGLHGFCPQSFLIQPDRIVASGMTPDDAEELADWLNDGWPNLLIAAARVLGGVRFLLVQGGIQ